MTRRFCLGSTSHPTPVAADALCRAPSETSRHRMAESKLGDPNASIRRRHCASVVGTDAGTRHYGRDIPRLDVFSTTNPAAAPSLTGRERRFGGKARDRSGSAARRVRQAETTLAVESTLHTTTSPAELYACARTHVRDSHRKVPQKGLKRAYSVASA